MNIQQAYQKMAALCSRSEKCISEIRQKLLNWAVFGEEAEKVLAELVREKFIDEQRFARYFVRDKYRFNKWGRIKIAYQLRMKEIPQQLIKTAFEEIDETEYRENALQLITRKLHNTEGSNQWDLKAKVLQFMQSRGFEPELVTKILDEKLSK